MIVWTLIVVLALAPLVAVTAWFAIEVFAGLRPVAPIARLDHRPVTAFVIPAHDEEAVIAETIGRVRRDSDDGFHILVVADNCTDRTAELARAAGAKVLIRDEPERRGKGFALAAARDWLKSNPPKVVIVLDADCRLEGADLLSAAAAASGRPCQSVNLLMPDLAAAPLVQISSFAFMIKNLVRQRGLQRLAGRAHLTGTGMALPWEAFERADLGGANIVEDLAMGLELAERSTPPMLIEGATVWSPAASQSGTLVQRRRWEGGYLATAVRTAPQAIARSLARADLRGLAAALNLAIPPLTLLILLNGLGFGLAVILAVAGGPRWPLVVELAVGIAAALALALAWSREGRRFASGATLLRLPLYLLWKIPLYLGLARKGAPDEWLRTGR